MFNLDQAIAEWRRRMVAGGIKSPMPLDELENHLREDVERRIRGGMDLSQAFQVAAVQLGQPKTIRAEFEKVENNERKIMNRGIIVTAGIIGILVGMALVMPAVAQYRHEGAMKNEEPWLFLIGSLMTLVGCVAAFRSLRKVRA